MQTMNRTGTIEFKDIDASAMRVTNDRQGIIEGLMSKTGNIDLQDDRVIYGAWKDTIKSAYQRKAAGDPYLVPFLWSHNWQDGLPPGGVFYLAETREGLFGKVQMNLEIQSGAELWASYKNGFVSKQSIGYKTVTSDFERIEGKQIRNLRACELMECSGVVFPANTLAVATSVKRFWPGYDFPEAKEGRVLSARTVNVLRKAASGIAKHVGDIQAHMAAVSQNDLSGYPVYSASNDEPYDVSSALEAISEMLEGKSGAAISAENMVKIEQVTSGIMKHVAILKKMVSEASRFNDRAGWPVFHASSSETFEEKEDPAITKLRELRMSLTADVPSSRSTLSQLEELNARISVDIAMANLLASE